jgi:membrane-bound lytic murein transglycosylase MltF
MEALYNVAVMYGVMLGTLLIVAAAWWAFDRFGFPSIDFGFELKRGNMAVAVVLAAMILGMFILAAKATASPLDRYDDSFQIHARLQFGYTYDWRYFKAQGMTESKLDPTICSQVGACGVMQFMPGTAVAMGLQDRFDAKESIRAGIAYDRQIWHQFQDPRPAMDRLRFSLSSYNAGPGHVYKKQTEALLAGRDPALWSEVAPFMWREPREYVIRIEAWRARFARAG